MTFNSHDPAVELARAASDWKQVRECQKAFEERVAGTDPGPWMVVGGKDGEDAHRSS